VPSEQSIQQHIRVACSRDNCRLFRNNCGVLRDQRGVPVRYGLQTGSSDLIGWRTTTITPEMVGQRVAVFTSIEVKSTTGRVRQEQQQWLDAVTSAGGIAGVARSVEDAERLLAAKPDRVPGAGQQQQTE
jgi:hypothetical protein